MRRTGRRASANLTAWLAANGYAYVNNVAVQSVSEDIVALNTAIETQVEAEWVRNAQNEFYAWLTDKGYTEDVSNATASIVGVDVDISALNTAVEQALQAAHVVDAQDEFQRWLTSKSYAYVTGVTIDEVDEDIDAVNAAVESQVEQKWIADTDAALQAGSRRADWTGQSPLPCLRPPRTWRRSTRTSTRRPSTPGSPRRMPP